MWLETLVQCKGIHNYVTSSTFTPSERRFLNNGLRFICTPPKTQAQLQTFIDQYTQDQQRGWPRFQRTLTRAILFHEDDPAAAPAPYLRKFAVHRPQSDKQAAVTAARAEARIDAMRPLFATELQQLDQYAARTAALLAYAANHQHHRQLVQHQRSNHSFADAQFIRRLMADTTITIKPADKNLGLVLVDTSWYQTELARMLSDTVTYAKLKFPTIVTVDRKSHSVTTMDQLKQRLLAQLQSLTTKHASTLATWMPSAADAMIKYLNKSLSVTSASLPAIYLLIKVHKPSGLCGRPIVPSTKWITTPASVVADHLLQDVMKQAKIPWLVKDTKSLINDIETMHIDGAQREAVFVTADIASLYTNIDTVMGLQLVEEFLRLHHVHQYRIDLVMALLHFVMTNSYLSFNDVVYHQVDGTAMGTSCAPPYANIIVYMLERKVLTAMAAHIHTYRRFLDDIWALVDASAVPAFILAINSLHPKLRFECVTSATDAIFLDLHISKGRRFRSSGIFDLRVHQKSMNLYLYIPFSSFHPLAMKTSFIQTELMRYIRNSSDREEYTKIKKLFFERLRDRGYPRQFLLTIFNSIFYDDRPYFLLPASSLAAVVGTGTGPTAAPPRSQVLLRRLHRQGFHTSPGPAAVMSSSPPVFIIPYSPLSRVVPTRSILLANWSALAAAAGPALARPPIIAYQSQPNLMKTLVYGKARVSAIGANRDRTPPKRQTQQTMMSFFRKDIRTGTTAATQ